MNQNTHLAVLRQVNKFSTTWHQNDKRMKQGVPTFAVEKYHAAAVCFMTVVVTSHACIGSSS